MRSATATKQGVLSDTPAIKSAAAEWFARRDGGFSTAQEQAFQRWLAADPRHDAAFAALDSAWSTFGRPVRTGGADELLEELATRARRRRHRRVRVGAAAAVVLFAIGAFMGLPRDGHSTAALPATASMLIPEQQVLPDGSVVVLKHGAQIVVAYTDAFRRVELKHGEAHFQVAKNPARPFVVGVSGVAVRAVGTAFSVQLGATAVEVLVTEGTVAVGRQETRDQRPESRDFDKDAEARRSRDAETEDREQSSVRGSPSSDLRLPSSGWTVDAGKRIVVDITPNAAGAQVAPIDAIELSGRLAWRNPRVEFSGTPLAEAVALLNREADSQSNVQFVIADKALESMRVSGIFRVDNTDAFVLLLEAGFGVEAERSGRTITLREASGSTPAP